MRIRLQMVDAAVLMLALSFSAASLSRADEPTWKDEDHSYDRALRAVRKGDAIPLSQAIKQLRKTTPGTVVATEYEFEFERWVYEFTIIDPQGYLRRVHLDARTGELVRVTDD